MIAPQGMILGVWCGSLNAELVKRYVAYVLPPPLITLALGLFGAW